MKTIVLITVLYFSNLASAFTLQAHSPHLVENPPTVEISDDFQLEFTGLIHEYLELKDELIQSNFENSRISAQMMSETLQKIGQHRLKGDAHMAWMEAYTNIEAGINSMTSAENIDTLRRSFLGLSDHLIKAVKTFGIEGVVYQQTCPMAIDSQEGNWLSSQEQIQNPYLPDTMPGCGEVIEKIVS